MTREPMPDPIDTDRSANLLIREHGSNAVIQAAMRADAMLAKGDVDGARVWKRILAAVGELQRQRRRQDESIRVQTHKIHQTRAATRQMDARKFRASLS